MAILENLLKEICAFAPTGAMVHVDESLLRKNVPDAETSEPGYCVSVHVDLAGHGQAMIAYVYYTVSLDAVIKQIREQVAAGRCVASGCSTCRRLADAVAS